MKTTKIDLFEHWELIPENVQEILEKYNDDDTEPNTYLKLAQLQAELNEIGYNINYGLDAEPFGLHQMKFCKI